MASPGASALDELTTLEAAGDVLVVPLGATEQHGPHLPLGTDTIIATALAASLDAVVAPALPYGSSGEHAGFAGTLSIGREALVAVLVELVRSSSFARVVFVSGHGGNAEPLATAVRRLRDEGHDVWAWAPAWGGDAHAGRIETSLLLALEPRLVGEAREPGNTEPLSALMPRLRAEGVRGVAPNGVLGDPTGASEEEGRALLAAAIADLRAFVASLPPVAARGESARSRGDAAQAGGDTARARGDIARAGGESARSRGDTAQAGGDTARAGGDTARAGGCALAPGGATRLVGGRP
ncbi:mycofactocin biosynthesis peptidyl-dipeptidase MftE [Solirubrobacter soli]|uniref:mycofactocin biosynthesis peptidyl-dipeptidase MftE n=1 Tax=Solirubrobacter soli TaxID=363832 RepID=UPI00040971CF|nr:mycofactocin biosynthesis peptidyl-dipeptidase MftE [Solirubrobacter soli]